MNEIKLKDICDLENGYAFKSSDYVDYSNTLNCRMSNIRPDGSFNILYNVKYLPDDFSEKYQNYLLKDGDLIIAMTDMAGDPKILGVPTVVDTQGFKVLLNQRVGKLVLAPNSINVEYLKLALQAPKVRDYFKRFAGGGVQLNVGKKDILNAPITLRTEKEQIYIASVFKSITKLKNQYKEKLLLLDDLIKARFVEMFGDEKNTIRLGDCCEVHARIGWQALTKKEHRQSGMYMLVTGTDFVDGRVNYDTCVYVDKERFEMDSHIVLRENDVLITKDGTIGKVAIVKDLPKPATLNAGVFVVRPDERFNKEYISFVFRGPLFEKFIELSKTGATIKHLNQKHLVEFNIPVPSMDEQEHFAHFFKEVDKSKVVVQKALDEAQTLFDSLMQQYFG